jgi:hypothetical protein
MLGKSIIIGLAIVGILTMTSCGGGGIIGIIENDDPVMAISGISDGQNFWTFPFPSAAANISVVASDESGIANMKLEIDGVLVASSNDPTLDYTWNAVAGPNGDHELKFTAVDPHGNTAVVTYSAHSGPFILFP